MLGVTWVAATFQALPEARGVHNTLPVRALAYAGLLVGLLGSLAHADEDPELSQARKLAAQAQAHFDLGEYQEAIRDFRDAYRLVPSPGFLYNLGQSYRLEGDCVSATTMYENYLRLAPKSRYRPIVKKHLSKLEPCVKQHEHAARLLASTAPAHPGRVTRRTGLAVGGVGLAAAGVGTWLAVSDTDAPAPSRREKPGDDQDDDHRTLATALISGGVVATAAGAALYYLGWREERRSTPTLISIVPVAHGATASIGWSF